MLSAPFGEDAFSKHLIRVPQQLGHMIYGPVDSSEAFPSKSKIQIL